MLIEDEDNKKRATTILEKLPRHTVADASFWEYLACFLFPLFNDLEKLIKEHGSNISKDVDFSADRPFAEIKIDFSAGINDNSPYWRIEGEFHAEEVTIEYHDGTRPKGPRRDRILVQKTTKGDLTGSLMKWLEDSLSIYLRSISRRAICNSFKIPIEQIKQGQYWRWFRAGSRQNFKVEIGNARSAFAQLIRDKLIILATILLIFGFFWVFKYKDPWGSIPILISGVLLFVHVIAEFEKYFTFRIKLLANIGLAALIAILAIISLIGASQSIEQVTHLSADSFPEAQAVISILYQGFAWSVFLYLPSYIAVLFAPISGRVPILRNPLILTFVMNQ